ncbi:MAG: endonuclease/exonuclease/phosphatase family protein [Geminicoccaceae bacterium]
MTSIRLGVWNMEWLNDLFTSRHGQVVFHSDNRTVRGPRSGNTVRDRLDSLNGVLNELAFDALVITEGPNTPEELQVFFDQPNLDGTWISALQRTPRSSQCVGIALRTDNNKFTANPLTQFDALDSANGRIKAASDPFDDDSDGDGIVERHKFERRPLYAEVTLKNGKAFRVVGLHLKSKGIFSAYEWSQWWRLADANRMRLLSQCHRFREQFLNAYLEDSDTRDLPLIVCGDINDGPGFDTSEQRLRASGIETLMGSIWKPHLALGNALFDSLKPRDQDKLDFEDLATTRFSDPIFNRTYHRVWIDHVLYSRNLRRSWVKDGAVHSLLGPNRPIWRAFPAASDHYPISVTVEL